MFNTNLSEACKLGHEQIVEILLRQPQTNVNAPVRSVCFAACKV